MQDRFDNRIFDSEFNKYFLCSTLEVYKPNDVCVSSPNYPLPQENSCTSSSSNVHYTEVKSDVAHDRDLLVQRKRLNRRVIAAFALSQNSFKNNFSGAGVFSISQPAPDRPQERFEAVTLSRKKRQKGSQKWSPRVGIDGENNFKTSDFLSDSALSLDSALFLQSPPSESLARLSGTPAGSNELPFYYNKDLGNSDGNMDIKTENERKQIVERLQLLFDGDVMNAITAVLLNVVSEASPSSELHHSEKDLSCVVTFEDSNKQDVNQEPSEFDTIVQCAKDEITRLSRQREILASALKNEILHDFCLYNISENMRSKRDLSTIEKSISAQAINPLLTICTSVNDIFISPLTPEYNQGLSKTNQDSSSKIFFDAFRHISLIKKHISARQQPNIRGIKSNSFTANIDRFSKSVDNIIKVKKKQEVYLKMLHLVRRRLNLDSIAFLSSLLLSWKSKTDDILASMLSGKYEDTARLSGARASLVRIGVIKEQDDEDAMKANKSLPVIGFNKYFKTLVKSGAIIFKNSSSGLESYSQTFENDSGGVKSMSLEDRSTLLRLGGLATVVHNYYLVTESWRDMSLDSLATFQNGFSRYEEGKRVSCSNDVARVIVTKTRNRLVQLTLLLSNVRATSQDDHSLTEESKNEWCDLSFNKLPSYTFSFERFRDIPTYKITKEDIGYIFGKEIKMYASWIRPLKDSSLSPFLGVSADFYDMSFTINDLIIEFERSFRTLGALGICSEVDIVEFFALDVLQDMVIPNVILAALPRRPSDENSGGKMWAISEFVRSFQIFSPELTLGGICGMLAEIYTQLCVAVPCALSSVSERGGEQENGKDNINPFKHEVDLALVLIRPFLTTVWQLFTTVLRQQGGGVLGGRGEFDSESALAEGGKLLLSVIRSAEVVKFFFKTCKLTTTKANLDISNVEHLTSRFDVCVDSYIQRFLFYKVFLRDVCSTVLAPLPTILSKRISEFMGKKQQGSNKLKEDNGLKQKCEENRENTDSGEKDKTDVKVEKNENIRQNVNSSSYDSSFFFLSSALASPCSASLCEFMLFLTETVAVQSPMLTWSALSVLDSCICLLIFFGANNFLMSDPPYLTAACGEIKETHEIELLYFAAEQLGQLRAEISHIRMKHYPFAFCIRNASPPIEVLQNGVLWGFYASLTSSDVSSQSGDECRDAVILRLVRGGAIDLWRLSNYKYSKLLFKSTAEQSEASTSVEWFSSLTYSDISLQPQLNRNYLPSPVNSTTFKGTFSLMFPMLSSLRSSIPPFTGEYFFSCELKSAMKIIRSVAKSTIIASDALISSHFPNRHMFAYRSSDNSLNKNIRITVDICSAALRDVGDMVSILRLSESYLYFTNCIKAVMVDNFSVIRTPLPLRSMIRLSKSFLFANLYAPSPVAFNTVNNAPNSMSRSTSTEAQRGVEGVVKTCASRLVDILRTHQENNYSNFDLNEIAPWHNGVERSVTVASKAVTLLVTLRIAQTLFSPHDVFVGIFHGAYNKVQCDFFDFADGAEYRPIEDNIDVHAIVNKEIKCGEISVPVCALIEKLRSILRTLTAAFLPCETSEMESKIPCVLTDYGSDQIPLLFLADGVAYTIVTAAVHALSCIVADIKCPDSSAFGSNREDLIETIVLASREMMKQTFIDCLGICTCLSEEGRLINDALEHLGIQGVCRDKTNSFRSFSEYLVRYAKSITGFDSPPGFMDIFITTESEKLTSSSQDGTANNLLNTCNINPVLPSITDLEQPNRMSAERWWNETIIKDLVENHNQVYTYNQLVAVAASFAFQGCKEEKGKGNEDGDAGRLKNNHRLNASIKYQTQREKMRGTEKSHNEEAKAADSFSRFLGILNAVSLREGVEKTTSHKTPLDVNTLPLNVKEMISKLEQMHRDPEKDEPPYALMRQRLDAHIG